MSSQMFPTALPIQLHIPMFFSRNKTKVPKKEKKMKNTKNYGVPPPHTHTQFLAS